MNFKRLFLSIFLIFLFSLGYWVSSLAAEEKITISTYYPSPAGVYKSLRLYPISGPPSSQEGELYYDDTTNEVKLCPSSLPSECRKPQGRGLWSRDNDNRYLYPNQDNWRVGIGTDDPVFKLTLDNDGGIIAKGTFGQGADVPDPGIASPPQFIWYPKKAAFRSGIGGWSGSGREWSKDNIGNYSLSLGENVNASGEASVALGVVCSATKEASTAINIGGGLPVFPVTASGKASVAIGSGAVASGDNSLAIGRFVEADAANSIVLGNGDSGGIVNGIPNSLMVKVHPESFSNSPPSLFVDENFVGIRTTSPTATLHVAGNIKAILIGPGSGSQMEYNSYTGDIGFDLAELFLSNEEVEPGDVLIIAEDGKLKKSAQAYDSRVCGIVSEAPAIVFEGSQLEIAPQPFKFKQGKKPPLALVGRVRCKVTIEGGPIKPGDLLVTSSQAGYAMKAEPQGLQPGVVIGKALEPFEEGEGKIGVLATLQ